MKMNWQEEKQIIDLKITALISLAEMSRPGFSDLEQDTAGSEHSFNEYVSQTLHLQIWYTKAISQTLPLADLVHQSKLHSVLQDCPDFPRQREEI